MKLFNPFVTKLPKNLVNKTTAELPEHLRNRSQFLPPLEISSYYCIVSAREVIDEGVIANNEWGISKLLLTKVLHDIFCWT